MNSALSPDYKLTIRESNADLYHRNIEVVDVRLPRELAGQLDRVATRLYRKLREVSLASPPQGGQDRPLRPFNSDAAKLSLAKAGAELHYRLFRQAYPAIEGSFWKGMGEIADQLAREESDTDPLLLQIKAPEYPLPWGILYDRSADGGQDLRTADDVDPAGFWGRRFDIYRSVPSADIEPQRGQRRLVKPVVGADVARSQEQRYFVDDLRLNPGDSDIEVDSTSSTVAEFIDWVVSGKDADLVYLFCHALPERDADVAESDADSWLGFGSTENDDRADMRTGLKQLGSRWDQRRPTNPVVILNACSSGQQDLIYGAPFVNFFVKQWKAQAFIGTDWPIHASFADKFGQKILRELLQNRRSVRDAIRLVSDEAAAESNYFPLMYAVYGLNTVQFIAPAGEMLRRARSSLHVEWVPGEHVGWIVTVQELGLPAAAEAPLAELEAVVQRRTRLAHRQVAASLPARRRPAEGWLGDRHVADNTGRNGGRGVQVQFGALLGGHGQRGRLSGDHFGDENPVFLPPSGLRRVEDLLPDRQQIPDMGSGGGLVGEDETPRVGKGQRECAIDPDPARYLHARARRRGGLALASGVEGIRTSDGLGVDRDRGLPPRPVERVSQLDRDAVVSELEVIADSNRDHERICSPPASPVLNQTVVLRGYHHRHLPKYPTVY